VAICKTKSFKGQSSSRDGGSRGIGSRTSAWLAATERPLRSLTLFKFRWKRALQLVRESNPPEEKALSLKADSAFCRRAPRRLSPEHGASVRLDIFRQATRVFHRGTIDAYTLEDFDQHGGHHVRCRLRRIQAACTTNERRSPDRAHRQATNAIRCLLAQSVYSMTKACAYRACSGRCHRSGPARHHGNNVSARTPQPTDMTSRLADVVQPLIPLNEWVTIRRVEACLLPRRRQSASFTGASLPSTADKSHNRKEKHRKREEGVWRGPKAV